METLITDLFARVPDFVGLAIAVFILWQQNNKLLDAVLSRIEKLEEQVNVLQAQVEARNDAHYTNLDN